MVASKAGRALRSFVISDIPARQSPRRYDMERGLLVLVIDRAVANARVIRTARPSSRLDCPRSAFTISIASALLP
jgi:hypothetical protein